MENAGFAQGGGQSQRQSEDREMESEVEDGPVPAGLVAAVSLHRCEGGSVDSCTREPGICLGFVRTAPDVWDQSW